MENNKTYFTEIGALNTKSLVIKLTEILGDSRYEIEDDESHLIVTLPNLRWFSVDPDFHDTLIIVTEEQFDYLSNLHSIGIPLNSNIVQDYLNSIKGESNV